MSDLSVEKEPQWRSAFRKILALEAHKGFADNAVSGGIQRFTARWGGELRAHLGDDADAVARLIEQPYRTMDAARRRRWVSEWIEALDRTGTPAPAAAVRPSVAPAPAGYGENIPIHPPADAVRPSVAPAPAGDGENIPVHPPADAPDGAMDGVSERQRERPPAAPPATGLEGQRERAPTAPPAVGQVNPPEPPAAGAPATQPAKPPEPPAASAPATQPANLPEPPTAGGTATEPANPPEPPALLMSGADFPSAPTRRRAHIPPQPDARPGDPDDPVSKLRRLDAKTGAGLAALDVRSVRDLLYTLPRRHDDRADLTAVRDVWAGGVFTLEGELVDVRAASVGQRRLQLVEAILQDDTGALELQWFGQGYLARALRVGSRLVVTGKAELKGGRLMMSPSDHEILSGRQPALNTGRVVPVYRLTQGLTARSLRSLTWQAIIGYLNGIAEPLTPAMLNRTGLVGLPDAIRDAHYPADTAAAERARRRLAFDEILAFQLGILGRRRRREQDATGVAVRYQPAAVDGFLSRLPFTPTGAQLRCVREILDDLARGTPPMSRLLQGEVGSGKTLVAMAAALAAASAGRQSALMAPTEVLAEQHFRTVARLLEGFALPLQQDNLLTAYLPDLPRPFTAGLLTGSTRARPRREVLRMASGGHLDLLVGTHALIQDGVELPALALAITDEQHRFGVAQRTALRARSSAEAADSDPTATGATASEQPHSLMMSATPIPRTLQLTLYGDLDVSTIDELPPGRQEIMTRLVPENRRRDAYRFISQQAAAGRQSYIICPLVEESDKVDVRAATAEHKRLSGEVFPDLRLGLLHGRMSARDKDKTMRQFRDGDLDILVATAVVEVGIDVPNATVMLIDGADRFGLSQLHQFRGRVGRGEHKSYCLLMTESDSERARERLNAMVRTHDGFQLAEFDLQMRHEGDIFGTSQSGEQTMLRVASLFDQDLMALARREANGLIETDPELAAPEHRGIAAERDRFLNRVAAHISD